MTSARARSAKLPPYPTLRDLPGVGQSIADDYARIGITTPEQLRKADPEELFDRLE
ncbi:MAG: helix-hairpin-helix domain-containing protein, partial [Actinomycetota bacterium]|nr:helix-hairpin-helix domain-containing protein [Actinomycetota bacterium]